MEKYELQLFITGQTPPSQRAVSNLRSLCEHFLPGKYEITVIDVLENPQSAENERILATPTLIRIRPKPLRRIIGDLSETQKVMFALDLAPRQELTPTQENDK